MEVTPQSLPQVELKKTNISGFHEGFWKLADTQLTTLATELSSGNGPRAAVGRPLSNQALTQAILYIEALRARIGNASDPLRGIGWMSQLRNDINYKLDRRVWSPNYRTGSVTVRKLKDEVVALINRRRDAIGRELRIDKDVRDMLQFVALTYRALSLSEGFPPLRAVSSACNPESQGL